MKTVMFEVKITLAGTSSKDMISEPEGQKQKV